MAPPGHERSLLGSLAAFTFLLCAAMIAIFVVGVLHARNIAVEVAGRSAQNLAASFAQQTSDTCEAVDGVLLALAERKETDGVGPVAREAIRQAMAALVNSMPRLFELVIVDAHGRQVVSNTSAAARPDLYFGDRPYFRYHREHTVSSVYISGPARSESQDVPVIYMTRRLERPDGSFAGVAVAEIAVSYFARAFTAVDLGPAGTAKLVADDGMLVIRQPPIARRSLRREPLFSDPYKYQNAGSYVAPSHIDGILRLNAFRRVDRYPLVIVIALAERDYLAAWWADTWMNAIVRGFIIVMIICFALSLGAQIGRRKRAEESLAQLALLDGLTGIANRRQFDVIFGLEWQRAQRERTSLALLIIDVDKFKDYNDLYGHLLGDDALIIIAVTIAAGVVRPADLAARYGGEEFAVLLPQTDGPSAVDVAERIRRAILELGMPHAGVTEAVASVSIGVASMVPNREATSSMLIAAADAALYDAKRAGRNRTSVMLSVPGPIAPASAGV
jgi:diguanylate cyclase (GGDEF)-like protein